MEEFSLFTSKKISSEDINCCQENIVVYFPASGFYHTHIVIRFFPSAFCHPHFSFRHLPSSRRCTATRSQPQPSSLKTSSKKLYTKVARNHPPNDKYSAACVPITFEKIVIVMITSEIKPLTLYHRAIYSL